MTADLASDISIDGLRIPVHKPATPSELGQLVRGAGDAHHAVYPLGGCTQLHLGLPPAKPGIGVDLRSLTQVIDYPARDMTITLQAGITLAKLQEILSAENQRLPIDVPHATEATLGGVLATNTSGPHRYGFGTLRDYVIGISVVNDEGHEVKAGGRVVKNVAGYDLCKLYCGSFGTLGIITQATLKLKPRPEEQSLVLLGCETNAVAELLDKLHASSTRPVCLELLNAAAVRALVSPGAADLPTTSWVVVVGYEENRRAVSWQVQQLIKEMSAVVVGKVDVRAGSAAEPMWRALTELPGRREPKFGFKANVLPHAVAAFCKAVTSSMGGLAIQAHAGNGIVIGQVEGDLSVNQARKVLDDLGQQAVNAEGRVVVTNCPTDWKSQLPVWGRPRADAWLMRAVKQKLDPRGLFNPGRFIEGI
jgi:glycolate oxidase FAD binding subunit